ncbi:MAG TPA: tetratricopeptide repeat protein, partial [Desulfobacteria bacterium]|nr:tetratricopeptide repeat protein [Desulfobacteria bacterium]
MSTLAPNVRSEERNFTILQAIAIILLSAAVFTGAGVLVGKTFFWKSVNDTRVDQQLSFYQAKVEAEPKVPENRVNLGYTYFLKGKNEEALRQFQVAADIDPKYAAAFYNMGTVYQEEKRYDEALEAFSKAAKLAPRDYKN